MKKKKTEATKTSWTGAERTTNQSHRKRYKGQAKDIKLEISLAINSSNIFLVNCKPQRKESHLRKRLELLQNRSASMSKTRHGKVNRKCHTDGKESTPSKCRNFPAEETTTTRHWENRLGWPAPFTSKVLLEVNRLLGWAPQTLPSRYVPPYCHGTTQACFFTAVLCSLPYSQFSSILFVPLLFASSLLVCFSLLSFLPIVFSSLVWPFIICHRLF